MLSKNLVPDFKAIITKLNEAIKNAKGNLRKGRSKSDISLKRKSYGEPEDDQCRFKRSKSLNNLSNISSKWNRNQSNHINDTKAKGKYRKGISKSDISWKIKSSKVAENSPNMIPKAKSMDSQISKTN